MDYEIVIPVLISFAISAILGPIVIPFLKRLKVGQTERKELESHLKKNGTPTMGGLMILASIIITSLFYVKDYPRIIPILFMTVGFGVIGFLDDYIKVFKKNKEGMHGRFKIVGQVGLGLIVGLVLFMSPDVVIKENMEVRHDNVIEEVRYHTVETKSTKTPIPFLKNNNFDNASLVLRAGD